MPEDLTLCQPACTAEWIEEALSGSQTITNIINEQTTIVNNITNNNTEITNIETTINEIENIINQINNDNADQDELLNKLSSEITTLKSLSHRQEEIIKGMQSTVILDPIYNNFQERCENVYIPQAHHIKNKYMEWDLYINTNESNSATNATYVCIRKPNATSEYSANDWQLVYRATPADMLTIIWIDPIEITHPYKHEWVVDIDPEKLADMLWQLQTLDLTKVEVSLGNVYFNPTIKDSITIQENLTVGNTITTDNLTVNKHAEIEHATIDTACIDELVCDTTINWDVDTLWDITIQNDLTVSNDLTTDKLHVDGHVHLPDARHVFLWNTDLVTWVENYVQEYGCINKNCP